MMDAVGELVRSQGYLFLTALLLGAALCFVYDLFRVFRRVVPHNLQAVTLEDFLFWILWTLAVMTMLDAMDRGVVRGFSLGAVFLGMLLYLLCFSRSVIAVLVFLARVILRIVGGILKVLLAPARKFVVFIRPVMRYNREKRQKRRLAGREKRREARQRKKAEAVKRNGKKDAGHRKQEKKEEKVHGTDRRG